MIKLKRIYEEPSKADGLRILVERLWPRGITAERAQVKRWLKEIAPSPELRQWYSHALDKWAEFRKRYEAELDEKADLLKEIKSQAQTQTVTFVYATRDEARSSALVLKEYLER